MKSVFIVQSHEAWENPQLLEIFLDKTAAMFYCQKMNQDACEIGDTAQYMWKEWSVVQNYPDTCY
jgi:hypothetical protein